ncbi:MAG: murein transglycosylase A [Deltaproteobacteria bacterium]|nr:murein transglycosylase A [Deltaproteobacteria bacterium]
MRRLVFGFLLAVFLAASLSGCAFFRPRLPASALQEVPWRKVPPLSDDQPVETLLVACEQSLAYLESLESGATLPFGAQRIPAARVEESLKAFMRLVRENPGGWQRRMKETFAAYQVPGVKRSGDMLFTGYFTPEYPGSRVRTEEYAYPLYARPRDLVFVNLGDFARDLAGRRLLGRVSGKYLVPYYTHREIAQGSLSGKGLEVAWLKNPVDAFFLQVQGSGRIRTPDGEVFTVLYDGKNGHAYTSIGRILVDEGKVPKEKMSMQAIRDYLENNPEDAMRILHQNRSFVFFRASDEPIKGCMGKALTPGRSVAMDRTLFPLGALGFIVSKKPLQCQDGSLAWEPFSRFVLIQDTGGAIRGPARLDLYWGSGEYAALAAGHMQHSGQMFLFLLKE